MREQEILEGLNDRQREAVRHTEGPLLILAGAGSGKTRVLVHRTAWLINVAGVAPWNILAITFTNKAAQEMKNRVEAYTGEDARSVWVSTFHSMCVRILRQHAELLGYTGSFTIYDADDQLTLMKHIFREKSVSARGMKERSVLYAISSAKNELVDEKKYRRLNEDYYGSRTADFYEEYQRRLRESNAMDFDDLIGNTVRLFRENPAVLEKWQNRFRYIMVDEYQDTNTAQFALVNLLAMRFRNLCVVGDDDQSIYRFRGANIRNILSFEENFPGTAVVKLEQNYRSTSRILDAANEVIRHNRGRKKKHLWTDRGEGAKVRLRSFDNAFEEAEYVCGEIASDVRRGEFRRRDCAVLYRTNGQSRLFEEKFLLANIPYRIVGGINFYARKEIKDLLAYLRTVENGADEISVRRILNVPRRGIGAATVTKVSEYAVSGGISFFDAVCCAADIAGLSRGAASKLTGFAGLIAALREEAEHLGTADLIRRVMEMTGYREDLAKDGETEAESRLDNIEELINKAAQYEKSSESPTLSGFLEEVSLIADIDTMEENEDRVMLFTLHSAKGLEFANVYMVGMEEGLFPNFAALNSDSPAEEIEEERRLAYVGITRAKDRLTLTCARSRMIRGEVQRMTPSRFIREIPEGLLDTGSGAEDPFRARGRGSVGLGRSARGNGNPYISDRLKGGNRNPYLSDRFKDMHSRGSTVPGEKTDRTGGAGGSFVYSEGDTVQHVKFGRGIVKEMKFTDRGCMVTVDFESWGIKKMRAEVAGLAKVQ